jgi:hypothetical protein
VRRLGRDHVIHRLPGQAGRGQHELDLRAHAAVGLPRVEHVDPYWPHRDLAAIEHVERAGVAGRHHHVLVELLQPGKRLVDRRRGRRVERTLLELVRHAAVGRYPAGHEADTGHAALHAVVAELLRVLLDPIVQLGEGARRILHQVGVVGEDDLAVEHRQHVAVDVGAQRVPGRVARHHLARRNVVAIFHEQFLVDHRRRGELVDHRDVDVPLVAARLLLRGELLVDLLRAGIAGAGANRAHLYTRVLRLELRREVVVDVVDHVLVPRRDDVERRLGAYRASERQPGDQSEQAKFHELLLGS